MMAMNATLNHSLTEAIEPLETPEIISEDEKQLAKVYGRLDQLLAFRDAFVDRGTNRTTVESFIGGGIGTAVRNMNEIIDLIPKVYEANGLKLDPANLALTARNSYPLIAEFAMKHMYNFGALHYLLSNDYPRINTYNPKFFKLVNNPNGTRLSLIEEIDTNGEEFAQEIHHRNYIGPATIGCPAMVNFGEGSANQKLWNWHTELAEQIYEFRHG